MAVPATFLNGEPFYNGKLELAEILARLDGNADAQAAEKLAAKEPFEVLVVGGGPAGATAAIYTARKGFRTGIAAERFGGQLHDTLGIENLPGTAYTEGPKLAGDLERHVGEYDIDLMNLARAIELVPATKKRRLHEVKLANGASLKARSLILSTGARWRNLGVPGEAEYRNKGVAYCPHCDGPLFKGKRIAVIGGGNSGVEAAIDLAKIVGHVTLIEYDDKLRADAVLQAKLKQHGQCRDHHQRPDHRDHRHGRQGQRVDREGSQDRRRTQGSRWKACSSRSALCPTPNGCGTAASNCRKHGEIVIDGEGRTNLPGIFGAGDVTTVPYKQIVVAMGEGS